MPHLPFTRPYLPINIYRLVQTLVQGLQNILASCVTRQLHGNKGQSRVMNATKRHMFNAWTYKQKYTEALRNTSWTCTNCGMPQFNLSNSNPHFIPLTLQIHPPYQRTLNLALVLHKHPLHLHEVQHQ